MSEKRAVPKGKRKIKQKEKEELPSVCFWTLYRFASKCDKLLISLSIIASVVAGLMLPLSITFVAEIFNVMVMYEKNRLLSKPTDKAKFLEDMHKFGIHYSAIGFGSLVSLYIGTAFIDIAAINQIYQIRQAYLRAALYQDISYFDMQQTGDFASKMSDDILKLEDGIGLKVSTFVFNITAGIGCIFLAFHKGWKLALLCLMSAPIIFALVVISALAVESGRASAVAEEVIGSIRTVYAYNGQEKEIARYKEPLSKERRIFIKKEIWTGVAMSFMQFGLFCSYGLSFYFGANLMILEPQIYDANVMFAVFFGVVHGLQYCGMGGGLLNVFGSATGAAAHIFHIINMKPIINPQKETGIKLNPFDGSIELNNVRFHYPARPDVTVLNGVSLTVKRGQSVALVGPSGCGKSSIIQLLVRFYDVSEGDVLVGGENVQVLSARWLRAQIGLVGQEPVLFNTTVRENIRYGREDASDADIEAAATHAHAHQFILKLPKGYDTLVGERGASLSGGQKQRIAIARALVRNPSILLLDEATSALDTASEQEVQLALEKASKGRTTVIVAHRLSTIRDVDMIYVMQKGVIAEQGSHDKLMAQKGLYYDMVKLQEPEAIASETKRSKETVGGIRLKDDVASEEGDAEEKEPPKVSFIKALSLNAPEWKLITVGCICGFVVGFTMPLAVLAFGHLFGSLSMASDDAMIKEVIFISLICVAIGSAVGTAYFIQAVCFGVAGARLTERLRSRMFGHMLHEDIAFFDSRANSTGALCAKLSAEAAHVRGATGQRVSLLIQMVGSVVLSVGLAFAKEWRVALIALVFVPLVLPVFYYQNLLATIIANMNAKAVERSTQVLNALSILTLSRASKVERLLQTSQIAVDALTNIRTVAALGREEEFVQEYRTQLTRTLPWAKKGAHLYGLVTGLSRALFNFMNAAALVFGGNLVASENVAYEKVLVTTQCIQMTAGTVNEVFSYFPDIQKGTAAAARVLDLLARKPTISDPKEPVPQFVASGEINFRDVEFHYPNRPKIKVLQRINLQVPKEKTIALVGRSGCGKTTIIQLLLRYYDPVAGGVSLDEVLLPRMLIKDARACFGLVAQEPVLFDLTIADNIAYGDNARVVSREEVIEVAKQANVHGFVMALPEGYETNIGKKGTQLSGGQKQRVAIARALIRKPKILLLDEATSALDTESEKGYVTNIGKKGTKLSGGQQQRVANVAIARALIRKPRILLLGEATSALDTKSEKVVQNALQAARAGRTCVMIAHRLSTVRDADAICVVHGGRVAERGTHQELMDLKGIYYELQTKH